MDGSAAELLVVAGPVVEGGEGEVVEDEVSVEGAGVEPQLVSEAYLSHVRRQRRPYRRRPLLPHRRRRRCGCGVHPSHLGSRHGVGWGANKKDIICSSLV